ncbi:MAG: DUF222 domain-containing protein, partial [Acidimicrobiia bacterium]
MSARAELPAPPPAGAGRSPQEEAWWFAEVEAVAVMGTVNVAVARLVAAVRGLLDTDGWVGIGIQSPEHWLCWKANLSRARAEGLVTIARRLRDLPECWAAFAAGRLGEAHPTRTPARHCGGAHRREGPCGQRRSPHDADHVVPGDERGQG